MRVEKDFEELFQSFNKHRVRYCIIGAFAVAFHAIPRYTKDIDVLVDPTEVNAKRIVDALVEFGFGSLDLSIDDFCEEGKVIQLGNEPVRIDVLTSVEGCDFSGAWQRRKKGTYGCAKVNVASLDDLIRMKQKSGRKQDQADLEQLKKVSKR